jgi:ketosteroid isomerase-like protein
MTANASVVVAAFIAAINRHDVPAIAALMTEDHVFVDSRGSVVSGRREMTAGWTDYFRLFPDYTVDVETLLAEGEVVAVFGSASGTYNGQRGLVPENRIEMPAAWRAVVQAGQVKRWQVYADWTEGMRTIAADAERVSPKGS